MSSQDQLVKTSKYLFLCIHGAKKTLIFYSQKSCLLEFDGASKGNPGQAGAGAVLRNDDGSLVCIFTHIISTCINFSNIIFFSTFISCRSADYRKDWALQPIIWLNIEPSYWEWSTLLKKAIQKFMSKETPSLSVCRLVCRWLHVYINPLIWLVFSKY